MWNDRLEDINLEKENKEVESKEREICISHQIAFFVKHEAVGGQGELLARCTFQIPDLVEACK